MKFKITYEMLWKLMKGKKTNKCLDKENLLGYED